MGNAHKRNENRRTSQDIDGPATSTLCYDLNQPIARRALSIEQGSEEVAQPTAAAAAASSSPSAAPPPQPTHAISLGCGGCSRKRIQRTPTAVSYTTPKATAFIGGIGSAASISKRSRQGSNRCITQWHRPTTNSIFSSHFKESNRNDTFDIEHLVAKGAFGVVFKVRNKNPTNSSCSNVSYALKVIKKSKLIADNSLQQIKDEADIQKLCGHHPFIVEQIDLWQNRHNLHILSEYVPNGELLTKIVKFSVDLLRFYVAEIAVAIDFLHNAGIIYRDAKPENILLTQQFHIKLTDFGLSKWLKLGANTRTICGTYKYMAPEILAGEPYGHAVDWWALGVIVCQMLTQRCPNIRPNLQQLQRRASSPSLSSAPSIAHINGCLMDSDSDEEFLPKAVQSLSHAEQDLIKRLLEVVPQHRIRSVMALERIALYKGYKIETERLLSMSPLDIIKRDGIQIHDANTYEVFSSELAEKAFQDF